MVVSGFRGGLEGGGWLVVVGFKIGFVGALNGGAWLRVVVINGCVVGARWLSGWYELCWVWWFSAANWVEVVVVWVDRTRIG